MTKMKRARAKAPPATMPTEDENGVYVRVPVNPETARAIAGLFESLSGLQAFAKKASEAIGAIERETRRLKRRRRR